MSEEPRSQISATYKDIFIVYSSKIFDSMIPFEEIKELPPQEYKVVGVLSVFANFVIFLLYTTYLYQIMINQKFISISRNSGVCEHVPRFVIFFIIFIYDLFYQKNYG